jgi:putative SOS response-associated peptidase YedK
LTNGGEEPGSQLDDIILQCMKWGLVPHWSKHEDKTLSTMNARAENLADGVGGMWQRIKNKRCAVMVEG